MEYRQAVQKRHSLAKTRSEQNNSAQTQKQRSRVLENTRKRLAEDPDYRAKNRETALRNTKKRLEQNPEYRAKNRQTALQNTRRKLDEDPKYPEKNTQSAVLNTRRRWQTDDAYRNRHTLTALEMTRRRLAENSNNQQQKYRNDVQFRQQHKQRVHDNKQRCQQNSPCHTTYNRIQQATATRHKANGENNKPGSAKRY